MTAIKAFISMKAEVLSTTIKDFVNIPWNGFADKFEVFFIEVLPVIVVLQDIFNGDIAGD